MPTVINRETGKRYPVTHEHLIAIRSNIMTSGAFDYEDDIVVIPEVIKEHRKKFAKQKESDEVTEAKTEETLSAEENTDK